ncbi:MAG: Dps family protein, partial [Luteibaculum sp.]
MQTTLKSNYIGISENHAKDLATELNQLLADYHIFYQNLRAFHWNIKGQNFFTLHEKMEEMYNDAKVRVDDLAERVLTLGYVPVHRLENILKESSIKEAETVGNDREIVETTLNNLETLLVQERKVLKLADTAGDEVTLDLMVEYMSEQEKTCWMLAAY